MGLMGLSKFGPRKVPGPLFRRDAASATRDSCGETRVWSFRGLSLSDDIMAVNLQLFTYLVNFNFKDVIM
ncbi:unnamed protein product [Cochlearia groenlandica]